MEAIGRPVPHIEGPDKVSGRLQYTADLTLPGALWGKCLRSPYPHARIVSIDTSRARRAPGVRAVLTARDLPDVLTGRAILDMPVLARDAARFAGEKVAAVAADTPEQAVEALALIEVTYQELPTVPDIAAALAPGAPLVHPDAASYRLTVDSVPGAAVAPAPNVSSSHVQRLGDLERGFAEADRVFEHTFTVPAVHHGYLEPHACLVRTDPDGRVDLWLTNKSPFFTREDLSQATGVPEAQIRVHLSPIGGEFGGKGALMDATVAYHLAKAAGRPVKMVMTYAEELLASNPRHDALVTITTGVTKDGRMTARRARLVFNNGAYAAYRTNLYIPGARACVSACSIPNIEVESLCVYTNTVPRGYMRAPGGPQVVFATECHMDMIARELRLDPLEFRLRNVPGEGDVSGFGKRWEGIQARPTLLAAAEAAGWATDKRPGVGRGIALFEREPRPWPSEARVEVEADGRVTLYTAVPETGTGAHTIFAQIVAEELGAPLGSIAVRATDTDDAPYDAGIGASRVTHTAGKAVLEAARAAREALGESGSWEARTARAAPVTGRGSYDMKEPVRTTAYCAQVAEVEVDRETGRVTLRRLVTANDVGTVLNPLTLQGQVEGGVVQGAGQALMEHLEMEDGRVSTLHLGDYKLPCIKDVPELTTVLLESGPGELPYQGKQIGELVNVPTPAAIANAVYDAVGVRFMELPITAEKVYRKLREGQHAFS